jgi:hypothetical protein
MTSTHIPGCTPCRLLDLNGLRSRRSLADAFEVLRAKTSICNPTGGSFDISPMLLPSGQVVSLVSVRFAAHGTAYIVPLPSCTHFRAICVGANKFQKFPIERLVDATLEPSKQVRLADGTALKAFEVIPTALPVEPTRQQWKIVHGVLNAFGLKHCYRSLREAAHLQDLAGYHFLDCSRLGDLGLPKLNEICYRLTRLDRSFANISEQTIANALRTFGIRLPARRPRAVSAQLCHI